MFKKRYVIKCQTFCKNDGHVRIVIFKRSSQREFETEDESIQFATKFRFKLIANIVRSILQYSSDNNYELRIFNVVEIDKP